MIGRWPSTKRVLKIVLLENGEMSLTLNNGKIVDKWNKMK